MNIPVIKNTATNYMMVIVRLVQGILVTRWLIQGLGETYYGLWALLWNFFVYGLLLDFGLGISAQKFTATELYKRDSHKFNMVISTIFSFHLAMSGIILLGNFIASFFLAELFRVSDPELLRYSRECFWLFGIGTACIFPLGIFSEMMVGLQKMYLRNYVNFISKIIELLGVVVIVLIGCKLRTLICFSLLLTMLTNLAMCFFVCRGIPQLRLRVKIDWSIFKEITHFSLYMYTISFSRLIQNKCNRPLVGFFCGLDAVGIFQLASRIPFYCGQITQQYQENVYPLSAGLYANGKTEELRSMVFNSMRWNSFLATGVLTIAFILTDVGLNALFKVVNPEVSLLCRWMLVSTYVTVVGRAIPHSFLVMAERHRMIAVVAVIEAVLSLTLYLCLLPHYGPLAIAWTGIGVQAAFALFLILPYIIKSFHYNILSFIWKIYVLPAFAAVLPVLFLYLLPMLLNSGKHPWIYFLTGGSVATAAYFLCAWLWVLNHTEREKVYNGIRKKIFKKTPLDP